MRPRLLLPVYAARAEGLALRDLGARELGVGKVAAALTLAEILRDESPAAVLLFGVCGAYPDRHRRGARLQVGDLCTVGEDLLADEGVQTRDGFLDLAALDLAPARVWHANAAATRLLAERLSVPIVRGATVSTCSGTDPLSNDRTVRTGAAIETMEGAAVHACCERAGVPLVHLRCVSNFCGDRDRSGWQLAASVRRLEAAVRQILAWPDFAFGPGSGPSAD
jgi:futalosine hydrolase